MVLFVLFSGHVHSIDLFVQRTVTYRPLDRLDSLMPGQEKIVVIVIRVFDGFPPTCQNSSSFNHINTGLWDGKDQCPELSSTRGRS